MGAKEEDKEIEVQSDDDEESTQETHVTVIN